MIPTVIKGYLFIQTVAAYQKPKFDEYDDPVPDLKPSYAARGWHPITHSIKKEEFLKVYAEREGAGRVDVRFNIQTNIPDGDNGSYQITGGQFAGQGKFVNVATKVNFDFKHFFVCYSTSPNGLFLRWQVGVNEIVDNVTDDS